jgi:hypothetical protein
VKKRLGLLLAGSLTFWLLAAYPAHLRWGDSAVVYSAVALLLCLVPTTATLLWAGWALEQSAEQQLGVVLGGTGVRMIFVLGLALVLHYSVPYFQQQSFWVWILVFYLVTLTLEMVLIVRDRQAADNR